MSTNAKVGVVMLIGILIGAWFILRIENVRVGREVGEHFKIAMSDAQGLRDRSPVFMRGVSVGKVASLKLEGDDIRIEILLDPSVKLREGTRASVASVGLLGEKQLVLIPGPKEAPLLAENAVIPGTVNISLDDVIAKLGAVGDNVVAITGSVRSAVGSEENQMEVRELVHAIGGVIAELRTTLADNQSSIRDTAKSVQSLAKDSARMLDRVERYTNAHGDDVSTAMQKIPELVDALNETAKNLREITEKINRGEGTIGKLVDDPKTAEQLQTTLTSVQDGVENLSEVMRTSLDANLHGDFLTARTQGKGYFSLDFAPPGGGFLRAGIVAEPFSLSSQREVVTQTGGAGGNVVVATQDEYTSRIAFTGLLGYRYRLLVGRAGVIESRPGVGIDVLLVDDRIRVTGDLWDFSRVDLDPHARAEIAFTVFKSIFLSAGWDEFLNQKANLDSFYLGAGLRLHLLGD